MQYSKMGEADIREAFRFAGLEVTTSRHGSLRAADGHGCTVQITEDDGTYVLTVLEGKGELLDSEVKVSGRMANAYTLGILIESLLDNI